MPERTSVPGGGHGDSFDRGQYSPGRSEETEAQKRQHREEKERDDRDRAQAQSKQEWQLKREKADYDRRVEAWKKYSEDADKAPGAHRVAEAMRESRDVLMDQYQQRGDVMPDFGQNKEEAPSRQYASVARSTRDAAQARIVQQAANYSAHRGDDQYCAPVLGPSGRPFQTPPLSMDWQQLALVSDQYAEAKTRISAFSNYRKERRALLDVSAVLIEVADDHFSTGQTGLGKDNVKTASRLLDTTVDFGAAWIPQVSMAMDVVQLAMGSHFITGEPLTKWDAGLLIADLIALGCSKKFTKAAQALVRVAAREGDTARLAKPWLNYIVKVDETAQFIASSDRVAGPNIVLGEQADRVLEHFLNGAKLSVKQTSRIRQYEKTGGFDQALTDLRRLANGREIVLKGKNSNVYCVSLDETITINARPFSSEGRPTLEVDGGPESMAIKVRYSE